MEILDVLGWGFAWVLVVAALFVVILQVPPVPSRKRELDTFFELAQIRSGETVFDLGAGDGRVMAIARSRYGAKVSGWELNPVVLAMAKFRLGVGADVRWANLWRADLSSTDVVFVFLMAGLMGRFEAELWPSMKPGARLISNAFPLPNVKPTREKDGVFLYIKPQVG